MFRKRCTPSNRGAGAICLDKKTRGEEQTCRKEGNQIRSTGPFTFELGFFSGGPSEGRNNFESAPNPLPTLETTTGNTFRSHEPVPHFTEKSSLPASAKLASAARQVPFKFWAESCATFPCAIRWQPVSSFEFAARAAHVEPAHIPVQNGPTSSASATRQAVAAPTLRKFNFAPIIFNIINPTLVGLGGVEPPTRSLGNCCSIHLSYSPTPFSLSLRFSL
jgi:hypothetical protein